MEKDRDVLRLDVAVQALLNRMIEGADELNLKNAVNGAMASAPNLLRFKGTPYDLSSAAHQAFKDLVGIRQRGEKLEDFLGQATLFVDPNRTAASDLLLKLLYEAKSQKAVMDALTRYAAGAKGSAGGFTGWWFIWRPAGDIDPATRKDLWTRT